MDVADILRELASSERFPRRALEAAGERREELVLPFIEQIEAYLATLDAELDPSDSLFFIVHLLAEWREHRAYRPVARLFHRPEDEAEQLFSDATTETLHRVMTALFDGDPQPIYDIILDSEASQWVRAGMCRTLAMLVVEGRAPRTDIVEFLRQAPSKLKPDEPADDCNHVWCGWVDAVSALNASDLKGLVQEVFERGVIDPYDLTFENFEDDLEFAALSPDRPWTNPDLYAPWGDTIQELCSESEEEEDEDLRIDPDIFEMAWQQTMDELRPIWDTPVINAHRHVGRNDSCPCGSGKKYKKCCLDSLDGEHS